MHIIGILIGIIGFVAVWYWRLKMLGDVAKDGRKVAETIVNLPRRMMFKHRSGKGGLDVVDDPREAATILMLEVAMARGRLTENQQAAIKRLNDAIEEGYSSGISDAFDWDELFEQTAAEA